MVTISFYHEKFQKINFSVGIEAENDPLDIPIFGFQLFFLQKVRSSVRPKYSVIFIGCDEHSVLNFTEIEHPWLKKIKVFQINWNIFIENQPSMHGAAYFAYIRMS